MPTGYTADVLNGKVTTLAPFLRDIARGFMLDMRDADASEPLPRTSKTQAFSIGYHEKAGAEALAEIHRLHGLTATQLDEEAKADFDKKKSRQDERAAEKRRGCERYDHMLSLVRAWNAPPAMAEMRKFALEQLTKAREFDCGDTSRFDDPLPSQSGTDWFTDQIKELQRQVEYHAKEKAAAEARQMNWSQFYVVVCDELDRLASS